MRERGRETIGHSGVMRERGRETIGHSGEMRERESEGKREEFRTDALGCRRQKERGMKCRRRTRQNRG
jgi:hypothetical protein